MSLLLIIVEENTWAKVSYRATHCNSNIKELMCLAILLIVQCAAHIAIVIFRPVTRIFRGGLHLGTQDFDTAHAGRKHGVAPQLIRRPSGYETK